MNWQQFAVVLVGGVVIALLTSNQHFGVAIFVGLALWPICGKLAG